MIWEPHRKVHPRKCDRCRALATWNLVRKGLLTEYLCGTHAPLAAEVYRIEPPPR